MAKDVAVLVGSLRREAFSGKLARALIELAPQSLQLEIVPIGQLPLYNQDYDDDGNPPAEYGVFRRRVKAADAILFVTPEHNRSVPAALKNALDVGSRPYRENAWEGKPGAVVSVSPGAIGAFGANHQLRQSLVIVNVLAMAQPEAYIGGAARLFDSTGNLTDERTRKYLEKFMEAFARWIGENERSHGQGAR